MNLEYVSELMGWILILSYYLRQIILKKIEKKSFMKQSKESFNSVLNTNLSNANDLNELLVAVCISINSFEKVIDDEKVSLSDLPIVFDLFPAINNAIEGKENIIKEILMLTPESIILQFNSVRQYLKLKDPLKESLYEFLIMGLLSTTVLLLKRLKK